MPAKIRTIKATSIFAFETFDFNKSIDYKGESLGLIKLIERKPGIINAKVYQDLNGDLEITKKDLIYKGKIKGVFIPDDLTNFFGTITLRKQMHRCDWEMQKKPDESIICTTDYVPTFTDLRLKSDVTGTKYDFMPYGDDVLLGHDDLFNQISDSCLSDPCS